MSSGDGADTGTISLRVLSAELSVRGVDGRIAREIVRLGRDRFTALQASKRGGLLDCRLSGDRVILGGRCATSIVGTFQL